MSNKKTYEKIDKTAFNFGLQEAIPEQQSAEFNMLQSVIDSMPQCIFWKDQKGVYLGCNENFAQDIGLTNKSDILGKTDSDIAGNNYDSSFYMKIVRNIMKTDSAKCHIIDSQIRSDSRQTWLDIHKLPVRDPYGNIIGTIGVYEDITNRKQAESGLDYYRERLKQLVAERTISLDRSNRALQHKIVAQKLTEATLRESEEKYRSMMTAIKDPVYICSSDYLVTFMNSAMIEIIGRDVTGEMCYKALHNKREICSGCVHEIVKQGRCITTNKLTLFDDKIFIVSHSPISHPDGSVSVISVFKDITEIEHSKNELKEQIDFLQKLIDTIPNPIFYGGTDGLCLGCNSALEEFLGKEKEIIIGKSVFDILPESIAEKYHKHIQEMLRKPGHQQTEAEIQLNDGTCHYIFCNQATYTDSSGNVTGFIGIVSDVTDLKKTQNSLLKLSDENEALIRSISSFLIGVDSNGFITTWNQVAENLFGIESEKVKGLSFTECGCLWEWDRIKAGISQCEESRKVVRVDDVVFTKKDGKSGYLGITLNPMFLEVSGKTGFLLMGADITDIKLMEMQFIQASKLESIGQLAAGIAHEINTPVHYVGDNILFLQNSFSDIKRLLGYFSQLIEAAKKGDMLDNVLDDAKKAVEKIDVNYLMEEIPLALQQTQQGVEQVKKIVRSIKDFSHPGRDEKTAIDINHALECTIAVAKNEWKYLSEIEKDFDESLPVVFGNAGALNQVFLNIIINAAHAVSDVVKDYLDKKGTISISTRRKDDWVEIKITDTGTGIPKDIRSRVFDPFFTTKEVGKGTGQGLAISHSIIVQKHGGSISFESEEGIGTTFFINLPLEKSPETLEE